MVHRLVGIHFLGTPKKGWQINHKDNNKLNNNVSNLEWVTQSENIRHSFDTGHHKGIGGTHYRARKLTDGENMFGTAKEAGKFYSVSGKVIHDMLSGRTKNRFSIRYVP